jgi:hypothetical protein
VYALKDNGMRQYQRKEQLFAFADQPVKTGTGAAPITLYAYAEEAETRRPATQPAGGVRNPQRGNVVQERYLRITTNIEGGQLDLLGDLEIRFGNALKTLDTTKVRFTDEQFNNIPQPRYSLDSTRKVLTLKYPWQGNTAYNIIVDKDFAEDSAGRKIIRTDTVNFHTKKESDYGSLKLRFINLDLGKNPVLLFIQNDQVKYTHVFTNRDVIIKLFNPGEYDMRILFDENRNGKWDPGEFFGKHKQPEKVQPVSRKLNVKPNWDNEIDIRL